MSRDWDLNAIVRSCNFTQPPPPITTTNNFQTQTQTQNHYGLNNHIAATSAFQPNDFIPFRNDDVAFEELQQQFFFYKPPPQQHYYSSSVSAFPTSLGFSDPPRVVARPEARAVPRRVVDPVRPEHLMYRPIMKRKNMKKVVHTMTKESLYSDVWSWRKYGQKPIKGSPHPRNYYRCSSWRGCPARKQVERSLNNPELYVVTFTGDHHHGCSSSSEDVFTHFPVATASFPPPIVSMPMMKTEEELEDDILFANLDEVDLFDGFFFD